MIRGRRHVGVLLVMALMLALGSASSADAYVYWGNAGSYGLIGRANLDGSAVNTSFVTGASFVFGVAVDGGHVYWGNDDAMNTIGRANLDGSAPDQSFIKFTDFAYPHGLAVDGAHVYWANKNAGTIGRANLDGSGVDQSFITNLGTALSGVAVDSAHIYWTNLSGGGTPANPQGPGTIGRANLDGSAVNPAFIAATLPSVSSVQGEGGPWGLAVDGAHVYWDNGDFGYIYGRTTKYAIGRANLDGSATNLSFIANAGENRPQGVAVDGAHVYWATGSGTIARANLDGSAPELSFIASGRAEALTVDALTPGPTPGATKLSLHLAGTSPQVLRYKNSLRVTFTCSLACTVSVAARATIDGRAAATWSGPRQLAAGQTRGVRFNLKTSSFRRLRAALRSGRRVRFVVAAKALNTESGATKTRTRIWVVALRARRTVLRFDRPLDAGLAAPQKPAAPNRRQ